MCYVDDLLLLGEPSLVKKEMDKIKKTFKIGSEGPLEKYLGIDIEFEARDYSCTHITILREGHTSVRHTTHALNHAATYELSPVPVL